MTMRSNDLAPVLLREKAKGKFRHLGITETAPHDPEHEVLHRAAQDGVWDVVMVGFHMMHQNARDRVFPLTRANRVGTLLMFAVRNIFSQPERLRATMRDLAAAGEVPQWLAESPDPLGFLIHEGGASTVPDAAYRFVRHEPGVDVVLFGTGDPEHLRDQHRLDPQAALARGRPSSAHHSIRPPGRGRAGRAASLPTPPLIPRSPTLAPTLPSPASGGGLGGASRRALQFG